MPPENNDQESNKEGNLPEPALEVLKEIKEKVDSMSRPAEEKPTVTVPSVSEEREGYKKTMGWSEEQMQVHERQLARAAGQNNETLGWTKLEKRQDIDKYRTEIEKELAIYPSERRTPDIMEKIYFMVKGKNSDSKPAETPGTKPGSRVVDTRVSRGPGYNGADPGMASSSPGEENKDEALSDGEQFVVNKLAPHVPGGLSEKDYAKSRNQGRSIRELRVTETLKPTSLADVELRRLTGR